VGFSFSINTIDNSIIDAELRVNAVDTELPEQPTLD
jgi:hypothetical protein